MRKTPSRPKTGVANYLKPYVCDQNYNAYTPREHASWRFIMRNASHFLTQNAHPAYLEGLEKTGISIDFIPNIKKMNRVLKKLGWGAVCVRGYIPPLVFLDFQSRKILPIAGNMRSLEHLLYTPAPDIVHEAAGHAPILANADYADYLSRYANLARKAIFSSQDIRLYEAVRLLSDAKENSDFTPEMIAEAEKELKAAEAGVTWTSEASKVSRMYWWTVEYGLVGKMSDPKIYGAGLLSSLSEGKDSLKPHVKKIPFDIQCIEKSFDITEPQPQLYVTPSFLELKAALVELEKKMAFSRGGLYGLETAERAKSVCTVKLDSGVEISGIVSGFVAKEDRVDFVRFSGPVQLCHDGKQLKGQGRKRHAQGFSSPIGAWQNCAAPQNLTRKDLSALGWRKGRKVSIDFVSGFRLEGVFLGAAFAKGQLLYLTFDETAVFDSAGQQIYSPEWGEFDLAVGTLVPSVYGGPGDWQAYGSYEMGAPTTTPGRQSPFSQAEKRVFALYKKLRRIRNSLNEKQVMRYLPALQAIASEVEEKFISEWLLVVEIHEILLNNAKAYADSQDWLEPLLGKVLAKQQAQPQLQAFIQRGLALNKAEHQVQSVA